MNLAISRLTSPRLSYSVAEVSHVTGMGRTTLYKLIGAGVLPSIKIGNRRLIRADDLNNLLTGGSTAA